MKIQNLIVIVLTQQLIFTTANQNFYRTKLLQNNNDSELSRNLERSLYGLNATREISLGDISKKVNEIIKDRSLKLISQSNTEQTNHYLLETPKGKEMNLNIKKNQKGFKLNLNQRELSLDRSLQIGIQDYDLNQVGHFLHSQFQQIQNSERKLEGGKPDQYEYEKWKEVIESQFPKESKIKLKESEPVDGPLEADKPYEFEVVTEEDHELFSIKVSIETVKNRERKILKLANNEKDHYKDNHSKYERRIVEADTETEIEDYLRDTMEEIMKAIGKSQVVQMDEILASIKAKNIKDLNFEEKEPNKVYDLEYKKEYIGYMNIYEIGEKYFGVSIKLEDRSFSTKLPKSSHNFNKAIEQFLKEFENFLTGADNGGSPLVTIEFKEAVDKIIEEIRKSCSNLDKGIKYDSAENVAFKQADLKDHAAKFSLEDIDDCVFSNNELLIEQISTGYFQYIHLSVDANIMKTEYMIGLNKESFNERAQNVIQEIVQKVETIKKSQEEADDDVDLKVDDVQKTIKETTKDQGVNCNKLDKEQFFTCEYDDTKSLFAVVKQTNSQILVNLMDNYKDTDEIKTSASNPSFSFQKRNGYDQMTGFKEDLTKFLEEQKARRLRKELL